MSQQQTTEQQATEQQKLQPLVEPGEPLTPEETARYARHLSLPGFGVESQRRLKNSRVLIVGAGGLGAPSLQYLAAAGVGTIGVIDDDVVEITNLQRQVVHTTADVGQAKVDSAAETVTALNPHVTVIKHPVRLSADNILDILSGYDIVLDGTDNFGTRYLVNDACELTGTPLVWATIFRFQAQLSVFYPGVGPTLRDLFPEIPDPDSVPSCAEGGVLGVLPGLIGTAMATEAIKLLTGIGEPALGRVLIYDAWNMTWNSLNLLADPDRLPVTDLVEAAAFCAAAPAEGVDDPAAIQQRSLANDSPNNDSPNIDPTELADHMARDGVVLLDVRDSWERDVVAIPDAIHVPLGDIQQGGWDAVARALTARGHNLENMQKLILHCKSGGRSAQAQALLAGGETTVLNLRGGVLEWATKYAPDAPQY